MVLDPPASKTSIYNRIRSVIKGAAIAAVPGIIWLPINTLIIISDLFIIWTAMLMSGVIAMGSIEIAGQITKSRYRPHRIIVGSTSLLISVYMGIAIIFAILQNQEFDKTIPIALIITVIVSYYTIKNVTKK